MGMFQLSVSDGYVSVHWSTCSCTASNFLEVETHDVLPEWTSLLRSFHSLKNCKQLCSGKLLPVFPAPLILMPVFPPRMPVFPLMIILLSGILLLLIFLQPLVFPLMVFPLLVFPQLWTIPVPVNHWLWSVVGRVQCQWRGVSMMKE